MFDAMRFVNHRVVPRHVAELTARLDALLPTLPIRRRRRNAVRRSLEARPRPLSALHALANLAEAEGWLDPAETMAVRKLAYRVSVVLERARSEP